MIRNNIAKFRESKWSTLCAFFGGLTIAYLIVQIIEFYRLLPNVVVRSYSSLAIFILSALILALLDINDKLKKQIPSSSKVKTNPEELLIDVMSQAYEDKRYGQVTFLGNAISDYLWYCGKKELRIKIASYLLLTSEKKTDYYTCSRVLIEDLGNTYTEIDGTKNIKKALKNIEEGLKIANTNKYYYLSARGYRNLACLYAYNYSLSQKSIHERDLYITKAQENLEKGKELLDKIQESWQKTDAEAALLYAECRILQNLDERGVAGEDALKKAIELYTKYLDTDKGAVATERLKKVYRELGYIYVGNYIDENNENIEKRNAGFELLIKALNICDEDNDTFNYCKIAAFVLRNASDREKDKYARPLISKCKTIISQLDSKNKVAFDLEAAISEVEDHWII